MWENIYQAFFRSNMSRCILTNASIHSFMSLAEWKFKSQTYTTYRVLWLQAPAWVGSYRGKIIVMAKVSLQARARLLLLRAIICLSASFSTPSWFEIEWMHRRTFKVDTVLMLWTKSKLPAWAALFIWRKTSPVSRDLGWAKAGSRLTGLALLWYKHKI